MISYHCRDQEANEAELQEVLNEFQAVPMPYFSMIVHLILALLQGQRGRAQEAAGHLAQGFHIAREKGFYHHLFVARPDLARACGLALELEVTEAMDYAAHLLTTRLADVAGPELERLARHLSPKVARKAQELQRTVHRARLPRLRLKTLGEFQVLRGKVPIPAGEWEGQQPRLLLKALVAHNPAGASREALMEALWPEESPARAEKNFKVNLHRLRKAQEPTLNKDFGSSYVYFQDNLVVLDPELCQVDAEAFRACCREAEQQEKAGKIKEALDRYQEAVALYGGDFLTGDLYASWAADKRDELRRQLLDTLLRLAALHERQGSLRAALECCQRVIQTDPLLEEAYQQLMLLNARLGRRSAALRAYADCQAALKRELNVDPDEVTQAIYRKILGSRTSPYQDK
jgi:DNA-binding SARP family transcriptional activator